MAARVRMCAEKLGITPLFGNFFNFCVNAPRYDKGIRRVNCFPHVDWKNLAIFVCIVFVYGMLPNFSWELHGSSGFLGEFNSKEKSWLVIWEAGVIIELPPGVFVMYPSALFCHFNVDMVLTESGERPTKGNSTPLDGADGRGSCVWFNQASLFQTSELGVDTAANAKEQGLGTECDARGLIEKGLFPI